VAPLLRTAELVRTLRLRKSEEKHLDVISRIVHLDRLDADEGRFKNSRYRDERSTQLRELRKHLPDKRVDEIYDRIVKLHDEV
jgi:hypothetical protein